MINGARPADVEEPLLSAAAEEDGPLDQAATAASSLPPPADVDPLSPRLLSHLLLLLRAARAWRGAVCLALLSVAESYVISRSGAVAGSFYKVLVDAAGKGGGGGNAPDANAPALRSVFLAAACWYGSAALLASLGRGLSDGLAWAWRARLAGEMQRLYLRGAAHYRLARPWAGEEERGRRGGAAAQPASTPFLDSPDQRIAQDLPALTRALADASAVLAAAPFGVCWYAVLVRRAFGGALWPVAAAALFFALGALAQRLLVRRVARLVFALEAAEGSYRFAHARLRGAEAEGVALYSSCSVAAEEEEEERGRRPRRPQAAAPAELAALDARLAAVLSAEGRLIPARWALAAATRLIDYAGALLNYACVAAAVFGFAGAAFAASGGGDGAGGGDAPSPSSSPGDVAQRVSVASFYLLTLIYSFTQVLDLSRTASDAAGLAARVGALYEGLRQRQRGAAAAAEAAEAEGAAAAGASGSSDGSPPSLALLELRSVRLLTAGGSGGSGGNGALVVSGLSVAVSTPPSDAAQLSSLLIVGPSGVGKTTLVRAIAGLAPLDGGEVAVLSSDDGGVGGGVFFVPQRPLAAPGATLRLQLTYPHGPCACSLRAEEEQEGAGARGPRRRQSAKAGTLALSLLGLGWRAEQQQQQRAERSCRAAFGDAAECPVCGGDARLLALLEEVGLAHLPSRLGLGLGLDAPLRLANQSTSSSSSSAGPPQNPVAPDWASVLSPGELQRLAFARLLRAHPRLAVLDEPVASLPASAARSLYASLARRGIAYVSCGHEGGGLDKVHEATLRILGDGNGGWAIERN
jgi:ABC-type uncharacterized transport system fused permease/ATPase subunit